MKVILILLQIATLLTLPFLAGGHVCPAQDMGLSHGEQNVQPPSTHDSDETPVTLDPVWAWKIFDLSDNQYTLSEFKGKVMVLHFWATWCAPCREELPEIQLLYDSLAQEGVAFILLSDETKTTLADFLSKHDYTLPVYRANLSDFPNRIFWSGLPTTLFVDRKGTIRARHAGDAPWNTPKVFRIVRSLE